MPRNKPDGPVPAVRPPVRPDFALAAEAGGPDLSVPDHPSLRAIRAEAHRLPEVLCSIDHLAEALAAPAGSAEFDGRLESFAAAGGLTFDPIGDAMHFRRA